MSTFYVIIRISQCKFVGNGLPCVLYVKYLVKKAIYLYQIHNPSYFPNMTFLGAIEYSFRKKNIGILYLYGIIGITCNDELCTTRPGV